ncbi:FliI/YscN family ATPase [Nostoc sp. HG1]|nr:FliI/YscN family ATPase [Nostoc sp. HG1]
MTSCLASVASQLLEPITLATSPRRVGKLVSHQGHMLEASGCPFPVGSAVRIDVPSGEAVAGEIIGFRGCLSLIQPLSNGSVATGARVLFDGRRDMVGCGASLLGRVIDGQGSPLDGLPTPVSSDQWPLAGAFANPLRRGRIVRPVDSGVRAINGLLTIGEGQRVAIIAGSGVGKSVLMGQILAGFDAEIIVVGLVGERAREVSDFVETKIGAVKDKSVVVAVPADHSPLLRLRAAMRACAIAEYFRAQGRSVLLMLDSLTRVAHAQREIGLAMGEPPTMKGYTPSSLSLIPQIVERAGVDTRSGGSITAIYTVLADGGDLDDPIVDAARAIVDGHIVLSRALAEAGVFPAIDLSRSLSRIMPDVVDAEHLAAAAQFRRLWSSYEQNRDLVMMGAYVAGNDAVLDSAIVAHPYMLEYIGQRVADNIDFAASRDTLVGGFGS